MIAERAGAVLLGLAAPVALAWLAVACGARTGLFLEPVDASDAGLVTIDDVALPGLDVSVRDVTPLEICRDASDTLVYVVTTDNMFRNFQILRFDPSSAQFTVIAPLACPDPFEPFSMAVDRQGHAYVLYYDQGAMQGAAPPGNIYEVNLNTGACAPTSYVPNAAFASFGMGFASNDKGSGETLYIASNTDPTVTAGGTLGALDEATLSLTTVGAFAPPIGSAELSGTGDGRLFGFWAPNGPQQPGAAVAQIDKQTAKLVGQANLPGVALGFGWAFAFWGGSFYLFTNPASIADPTDQTSIVQRFDPATGDVTQIASYPQTIVGAGVSTCAPVQ